MQDPRRESDLLRYLTAPVEARTVILWGPRQVAAGAGVAALATLLAFLAAWLLARGGEGTPVGVVLGATAFVHVALGATAYALGPRTARRALELLAGWRLSARAALGWAALAFVGSVVATVVYVAAAASFTDGAVPTPIPAGFLDELPLVTVLLVVLVGPAAEEIFFRGFCFAGLVGRWGFWGAAGASSALFGLAHVDPALMGPAFVSGLVFAWAYWRTGSLWPVVLAHVARNAVALGVVASS